MNKFFVDFILLLHWLMQLKKQLSCGNLPDENVTCSGTQRLVRTACKAFHHKESQQSGSSALFRTYLKQHKFQKIPLDHFIGNRFNVLFYDAAGVYYLHSHMTTFIENIHRSQANRLLLTVLADLKIQFTWQDAELLLVDKMITGLL